MTAYLDQKARMLSDPTMVNCGVRAFNNFHQEYSSDTAQPGKLTRTYTPTALEDFSWFGSICASRTQI